MLTSWGLALALLLTTVTSLLGAFLIRQRLSRKTSELPEEVGTAMPWEDTVSNSPGILRGMGQAKRSSNRSARRDAERAARENIGQKARNSFENRTDELPVPGFAAALSDPDSRANLATIAARLASARAVVKEVFVPKASTVWVLVECDLEALSVEILSEFLNSPQLQQTSPAPAAQAGVSLMLSGPPFAPHQDSV